MLGGAYALSSRPPSLLLDCCVVVSEKVEEKLELVGVVL